MNSRLRRVAIQLYTLRVAGKSIHDRPANATGLIDLKTEVIVRASNWVVMLMNDEMSACRASKVFGVK